MNKIAIKTLVMAAVISSPLAIEGQITTGPYARNLTPASDHSLGLKQVLFIRTQFSDLATSKTQADCQTVMEQVRQRYAEAQPEGCGRGKLGVAAPDPTQSKKRKGNGQDGISSGEKGAGPGFEAPYSKLTISRRVPSFGLGIPWKRVAPSAAASN